MLVPLAWTLSLLFESPVREGVLTLGLSSTEVAAVGLVALAGGDAALALGALAGSSVPRHARPALHRRARLRRSHGRPVRAARPLALVVLVPLAAGVLARVVRPRLARGEPWFAAGSTLAVVVLDLRVAQRYVIRRRPRPCAASERAFLALSAVPALGWARLVIGEQRPAVAFAVGLRDFAVAATLATQAFGDPAATVGGIYGVLMLVAGALATAGLAAAQAAVPRRAGRTHGPVGHARSNRGNQARAQHRRGRLRVVPSEPLVLGRRRDRLQGEASTLA